jgi:hypothetical protein
MSMSEVSLGPGTVCAGSGPRKRLIKRRFAARPRLPALIIGLIEQSEPAYNAAARFDRSTRIQY